MGNEAQSKPGEGTMQSGRQEEPLEDNSSPTNDPRPLGGSENRRQNIEKDDQEEGEPTNDPRPLGQHPPPVPSHKAQPSWKDPVNEAEQAAADVSGAASNFAANAKDVAADKLRAAKEKALQAADTAKSTTTGVIEAGKQAVKSFMGGNTDDQSVGPHKDEVDLSPQEQFTRHHVKLDEKKLHHFHRSSGPIDQLKHKASDFVHAARAVVEPHLPGKEQAVSAPSSNEVTLQSLKYKDSEPLHMIKVAEGRNIIVDESGGQQRRITASPTNAKVMDPKIAQVWTESGAAASKEGATQQESAEEEKKENKAADTSSGSSDVKLDTDVVDTGELDIFGVTSAASGARSKL